MINNNLVPELVHVGAQTKKLAKTDIALAKVRLVTLVSVICFECKFFQNYMLYIFELFLLSIHTFVLSFLTSHLPGVFLFSSLSLLCPFLPWAFFCGTSR